MLHVISWKLRGGGSLPRREAFRTAWASAAGMGSAREGDSKVQWSGEPLAYENTLGSSLISATDGLHGLEPQSLHLLTRILMPSTVVSQRFCDS